VTALRQVTRAPGEPELLRGEVNRLTELVRTLRVRNQQLEQALSSRIVIEQAKGVLVERLALTPDEAFELIRTAARRHRITVRELAFEVVTTRQTPAAILAPSRAAS
jgi:AmiR/NasT family two-component response regulator